MKTDRKDEYSAFQATLIRRVGGSVALSITIVMAMYLLFWKRRMGNWIVWFLQNILQMDFYDAYNFYGDYFRGNKDRFFYCGYYNRFCHAVVAGVPGDDPLF